MLTRLRRQCSRLPWTLPQIWNGIRYRLSRRRVVPLDDDQMARLERGGFVGSNSGVARPAGVDGTFRISCWNISYGQRYEQVLAAMKDIRADIYVLQEVDDNCRRSGRRNVARELAKQLSLHYVFASEFQELAQQQAHEPARHGQAVLSHFPITHSRLLRFQHQAHDWSNDLLQPRRGGRMALIAEIQLAEHRLVIYNAHLESRGSEHDRTQQMQEIVADARTTQEAGAVVIAGDLNTRQARAPATSPVVECAEREQFADATRGATPCTPGGARLDWILARGLLPVAAPTHRTTRASDHQPISVDARFPAP